nr:hypothetical protein CFP56_46642 [Quercus suber]
MAMLKGQATADSNKSERPAKKPRKRVEEESDYESGTDEDEESDSYLMANPRSSSRLDLRKAQPQDATERCGLKKIIHASTNSVIPRKIFEFIRCRRRADARAGAVRRLRMYEAKREHCFFSNAKRTDIRIDITWSIALATILMCGLADRLPKVQISNERNSNPGQYAIGQAKSETQWQTYYIGGDSFVVVRGALLEI